MNHVIDRLLADPLFTLVVKATLLLAVGVSVDWLLRRRPASERAASWRAVFVLLVLLPLLPVILPHLTLPLLSAPGEPATRAVPVIGNEISATGARATSAAQVAVTPSNPPVTGRTLIVWLWLTGACALALGSLISLFRLAGLKRLGKPYVEPVWRSVLCNTKTPTRLVNRVQLRESGFGGTPMTWGWRKPVVLLPRGFGAWSEASRRATLAHELAHIERRDWPTQMLTRLACALFWFHPVLWWAARRQALECEKACDDQVLLQGSSATDYAEHLLELAVRINESADIRTALAMSRPTQLAVRVHAILNPLRERTAVSKRLLRIPQLVLLGIALPLASVQLVSATFVQPEVPLNQAIQLASNDRPEQVTARGHGARSTIHLSEEFLTGTASPTQRPLKPATSRLGGLSTWLTSEGSTLRVRGNDNYNLGWVENGVHYDASVCGELLLGRGGIESIVPGTTLSIRTRAGRETRTLIVSAGETGGLSIDISFDDRRLREPEAARRWALDVIELTTRRFHGWQSSMAKH